MQIETINDPIDVEARFTARGMRPLWFVWQGRRHLIQQVTCAWIERDGQLVHRGFSVTDGEGCYELRFDVRALAWELTRVAWPGA